MSDDEGLRAKKKRETREAISTVATGLFLARGFEAVTVAEIAAAAGVSKMTVFNYFPRKEDLFFDRTDELGELVAQALGARARKQSPIGALRALADALIADRHPFARVDASVDAFWQTVEASPALVARARELGSAAEDGLATALARAAGAPEDDPLAYLAATLLASTWRAAYRAARKRHAARANAKDVRAAFESVVERGWDGVARALKGTPYA